MASMALRTATLAIVATFSLSISPIAEAAGRSTTSVSNTILNGKGAPKASLGIDGDFYIDTRSLLIYGPKAKGKWPTPHSIQGPTGPSGSDGRNGSDGKAITNSNLTAIAGPQGEKGEKGEKGDPGLPGVAGAPGVAGLPGAQGPAGSNGSSGPQGLQGAAGATGATGAQGPAGAVGPSEVTVIDIPQWTLSSVSTFSYAASTTIGSLTVGSSYKFDIYIYGTSTQTNLVLGADVICPNANVSASFIRSDSRYATYSSASSKYAILITGVVSDVTTPTSLSVRVIDAYGETGSGALNLTGKAYITLVGAIR